MRTKTTMLLITSLMLASHAEADDFARTAVSGPEAWKRYKLRGIQLGSPRKALATAGFTCGKRANQRCFKLVDDRCKKGRCEFKEDEFGQWFELAGAKTQLDFVTCATTETDSALVHECRLQLHPRQLLTKDSTLGKALVDKYGEPVEVTDPSSGDSEGGGRMYWWNPEVGYDGPNIMADCDSPRGSSGYTQHYCSITVSDRGVVAIERARQEDINKQRMRDKQPTKAPSL